MKPIFNQGDKLKLPSGKRVTVVEVTQYHYRVVNLESMESVMYTHYALHNMLGVNENTPNPFTINSEEGE